MVNGIERWDHRRWLDPEGSVLINFLTNLGVNIWINGLVRKWLCYTSKLSVAHLFCHTPWCFLPCCNTARRTSPDAKQMPESFSWISSLQSVNYKNKTLFFIARYRYFAVFSYNNSKWTRSLFLVLAWIWQLFPKPIPRPSASCRGTSGWSRHGYLHKLQIMLPLKDEHSEIPHCAYTQLWICGQRTSMEVWLNAKGTKFIFDSTIS